MPSNQEPSSHLTSQELWKKWSLCAASPEVSSAIIDLYKNLSQEIKDKALVCMASGRCCKFDTYGHRLYVTGLEIAWVLQQITLQQDKVKQITTTNKSDPVTHFNPSNDTQIHLNVLQEASKFVDDDGVPLDGCVYQKEGLCTIHEIRPLGCRIYFCDKESKDWQNDLYERYLNQLRDLHTQYDIPYRYMEWRTSLKEASDLLSAG